ncbi:MAG: NUDIX hydrolase [Firmicutes bacterium]|nr:NUDIX hydrolase [Bacillota bacterium]
MTFEEKTLSREVIYEGRILNLIKEEVMTVSGQTAIREMIEHNGGVGLVAITSDNKIIMVKQFRKALERDMLEIPAGKLEKGEDPLEAAARELEEETGYTAENIEFMTRYYPSVGYIRECLYLYLCTGLSKGEAHPDDDEAIDTYMYTMEELETLIAEGNLQDGKSMAALYAAKLRLGSAK